jgi:hypothetical protein
VAELKSHAFRAHLPWRSERLTECGRPATAATVEYAELVKLAEPFKVVLPRGQITYRDGMPCCGVCICQGEVHSRTFADDPIDAIERELLRDRTPNGPLALELAAAALLIAEHWTDFDTAVLRERALAGLGGGRRRP